MTTYNDKIGQYITDLFAQEDDTLQRVRRETPEKGLPAISISPEEGKFIQLLVQVCGAKKAVEIGTLGGYSGIWIARGLAPGGRLITLEKKPAHAAVAQEYLSGTDVADRVEVRVGNAHQLLEQLTVESPFDFVFVDADKSGYDAYFDWALENTRTGAVIALHNAFRGGAVLDPSADDRGTQAIEAMNRRLANEPQVISTIYPAGDGTLLAVKIA